MAAWRSSACRSRRHERWDRRRFRTSCACKCGAGRAVRSQDLLKWLPEKSLRFNQGRPDTNTGFWAAYPEKTGDRHVTLIDPATGTFYGTADCTEWPAQWYYQCAQSDIASEYLHTAIDTFTALGAQWDLTQAENLLDNWQKVTIH